MRWIPTRAAIRGWLLACAVGGAPLHAAATLVADVNTAGSQGAGFGNLGDEGVVLDDRLFVFVADDGITGSEPWVLDLWTGASERLADVYAGPASSLPGDIVAIGSQALFTATDPDHGKEIWRTDGTPAGTELVLDIFPGTSGSSPLGLYPIPGDRAVFRADDGVAGAELWISDGTPGGTYMVEDIDSGPAGSVPSQFAVVGSTLFFRASDGVAGIELWKWQSGTTSLVADIAPGADSSSPNGLYPVGSYVVFSACRASDGCELWRSDGTSGGTVRLDDIHPAGDSDPHGFFWHAGLGLLFFDADDGVHGNELWKRTAAGPATRVTDLNAGTGDSDPTALGELPGKLTFVADDGAAGSRLYSYDGATVSQVKSLSISGVPGLAEQALSWNGRVYFIEGASSCWSTDGTSVGTVKWTICMNDPPLTVGDGRLLYGKYQAGEREIWSIDPSDVLTQETDPTSFSSDPDGFAWLGPTAFFAADDGVDGRELWVSDGTPGGTDPIDIAPGATSSDPQGMLPFGGEIWFSAYTGTTGDEPWHSDGTTGGTAPYELSPGTTGSAPSELVVLGSHLFVAAYDDSLGAQLFRIASAALPPAILDYNGDPDLYPEQLTPAGTKLYFFAENPATGRELFVADESAAHSTPLEVIAGPGEPGSLGELVSWQNLAWFVADDGVNGPQIWVTDGVAAALRITNLGSGDTPSELAAGPDGVYFVYDDGAFGSELWRTVGMGATRVTDIAPGAAGAYPGHLTRVGDRLYFSAGSAATGDELWWTDGTNVGLAADIAPGSSASYPTDLRTVGDRVVFVADDGTGKELWLADEQGALRLPEAWEGTGASNPAALAVDPTGGRVFYSALSLATWREPFRVQLLPFADGFETGDTRFWSATAP
ncbi:MAG: hypothetical protein KDB94_13130 [Acidobacteria bacterium]|nr:hypothetical protein [Acidobacteriota bacterium]